MDDYIRKISIIECGGTISSKKSDGVMFAGKKSIIGESEYAFYRTYSPFCILSENLEFSHIDRVNETIGQAIADGAEGIIIACGTDNLCFFSAAIALTNPCVDIPIVLVSASLPLEDSNSNGYYNLFGGILFINLGHKGVFVAYKNVDEVVKIHYGARLLPSRYFDGYVSSIDNRIFGEIRGADFIKCEKNPYNIERERFANLKLDKSARVAYIYSIVGTDYKHLSKAYKEGTVFCHDAYHSGTVKTEGENNINDLEGEVYLAGGLGGDRYESLLRLGKNIKVMNNISPIALYVKLLISHSFSPDEKKEYLTCNTAGEFIGGY